MMKIVFTCGDVNGIGPEIVVKTLAKFSGSKNKKFYFVCPANVFLSALDLTDIKLDYEIIKDIESETTKPVQVISRRNVKIKPGYDSSLSGLTAYHSIKEAFEICASGKADAMVTAPISKSAINLAGFNFPGHTEMLAGWSNTKNFVMMFLSKKLKAALVTIHESIKDVPRLISKRNLNNVLSIINHSLVKDFGIAEPRIAVLGLNPHAGESGLIGKEEKNIIVPVIRKYENIFGPFSPDAFFANHHYRNYDIVMGMYHDQVLIPFKMLSFSSGVNYTAGLKIVRTSPDHGTAFDIAWKNVADPQSTIEACYYAEQIVKRRMNYAKTGKA